MKTIILSIFICVCFTFSTQAQEKVIPDNAVGLRISPGDFTAFALSYQRQMFSENNRIEVNIGMKTGYAWSGVSDFFIKGYYHWVFNIVDKLDWYAGPGVGVEFITFDIAGAENITAPLLSGEGGVEYSFDFPLQVSLSLRPTFAFYDNDYGYVSDNFNVMVGVGAHYTF